MTAFSGDRRIAARLALVAALAYLPFSHCHFSASDETGVYDTARSILFDGDPAIEPGKHIFRGPDGRHYSHFAVGQSLLALPLVAAGEALGALLPEAWGQRLWGRTAEGAIIDTREEPGIFAASLWAPAVTGLLVGLFFAFERRLGASRGASLAAAVALGAGSYVAAHSVFFLRHTSEGLAVLASLYGLLVFRQTGRVGWLALGTACAAALVLIRVPAAVAGPGLAAYLAFVLWERWRAGRLPAPARVVAAALGPPFLLAALHLASNRLRWGHWIASPMLEQSFLLQGDLLAGLYGLLLSPGAGMFVYTPLLLLLPATAPGFWRAHRAEALAVLGVSAGLLWMCGSFHFWHGLWSAPGPRYLFALVALWMLPLGLWLDAARGPVRWRVAGVLAALGAGVQLALILPTWRRAVELAGYQAEIQHWGFLYEPLRGPIVACARAVAAGEIDVWLWALAMGVPGRPAQPWLAALLLLVWAGLFAWAVARLRAAWAQGEGGGEGASGAGASST